MSGSSMALAPAFIPFMFMWITFKCFLLMTRPRKTPSVTCAGKYNNIAFNIIYLYIVIFFFTIFYYFLLCVTYALGVSGVTRFLQWPKSSPSASQQLTSGEKRFFTVTSYGTKTWVWWTRTWSPTMSHTYKLPLLWSPLPVLPLVRVLPRRPPPVSGDMNQLFFLILAICSWNGFVCD